MPNAEMVFEVLWSFLVMRLQRALSSGITQTALAEQIGVKQPTINRWLKGERGKDVSLRDVLKILQGLGVTMSEMAAELGDEDLAILLEAYAKDRDQMVKLANIIRAGGSARRKIDGEIDFINDQLKL